MTHRYWYVATVWSEVVPPLRYICGLELLPVSADEPLGGLFTLAGCSGMSDRKETNVRRVAIQGEQGSNSHMAALRMLGPEIEVVPCVLSADVIAAVERGPEGGGVDGAVLPIENSLHGSVAEHYDLLLGHDLRLDRECVLPIQHNLIAAPGVQLDAIKRVISHPVALSQCRASLQALRHELPELEVQPFYDTAGSVKHVMEAGLRDTAGLAPQLAAKIFQAAVLRTGLEDHKENWTRFHLVRRAGDPRAGRGEPNKLSTAFAVELRAPGDSLYYRLESDDLGRLKNETHRQAG